MKRISIILFRNSLVILSAMLFAASGCSQKAGIVYSNRVNERIEVLKIYSPELADCDGEESLKTIFVVLPPEYDMSEKYYPVIYYFPGYFHDAGSFYDFEQGLYLAQEENLSEDFVFVSIDGENQYGGSFYVNSSVAGNFENYIINEIIPLVEKRYRILEKRESRGFAGTNTGGFGALNLAMRHPEVVNSVYVHCGTFLVPGDLDYIGEREGPPWFLRMQEAYYYSFYDSLNQNRIVNSNEMNTVTDFWYEGAGNWEQKIKTYLLKDQTIQYLSLNYGVFEKTDHTKYAAEYLSALFSEYGVKTQTHGLISGRLMKPGIVKSEMMPFFSESLDFQ